MRSSDRDDLVFLYVAGGLEGVERDEIEEWLASGAPEAAEQLAQAEQEVALLTAAQPRRAPPASVRTRLAARAAAGGTVAAPNALPRRASSARIALAASIAGLLAAGVAGFAGHQLATHSSAERVAALEGAIAVTQEELADVTRERDALDAELADLEAAERALESDLVLARKTIGVLEAEEAESLALAGTGTASGARGRVFWDWDAWYCYARVAGLAKDPQRIYAMWLFTEDGAIGVGTFRADEQGNATFLSPVPHDVGHVLRAGVSIEPDDDLGMKPRGEVVMLGEVPERS